MKHIKDEFSTINHLNPSCLGYDTNEAESAGWNRVKYGKTLKKNRN